MLWEKKHKNASKYAAQSKIEYYDFNLTIMFIMFIMFDYYVYYVCYYEYYDFNLLF